MSPLVCWYGPLCVGDTNVTVVCLFTYHTIRNRPELSFDSGCCPFFGQSSAVMLLKLVLAPNSLAAMALRVAPFPISGRVIMNGFAGKSTTGCQVGVGGCTVLLELARYFLES